MFLGLSVLMFLWNENRYQVIWEKDHYETRASWMQATVFFSVIIFFCGLRSGIADTGTYISMFQQFPVSISAIDWEDVSKDKGFYLISVLYKQFISTDFHGWLFLIALISGIATMYALRQYSEYFGMSCYLFIASTMFVYLVNGMRQYICVSIMFAATRLIVERRFKTYLILILLLSTIHASVLIFIPAYFLVNVRPWSPAMFVVVMASAVIGLRFDQFLPYLGSLLEETQYEGYIDYLTNQGVGANILRLLIAAIPCLIALIARKVIEDEGNTLIDICINMLMINLCLYFIASFSSGMVIGRITTYFDIYNLILLPWLLKHAFTKKSSILITLICMLFYVVYFYYQIVITWGLVYESDILHIFC
jgi:hypothetical protein